MYNDILWAIWLLASGALCISQYYLLKTVRLQMQLQQLHKTWIDAQRLQLDAHEAAKNAHEADITALQERIRAVESRLSIATLYYGASE